MVIEHRHDRTPVQDHPVAEGVGECGLQGLGGDGGGDRFDPRIVDPGVGDQDGEPEVALRVLSSAQSC